MPYFVWLLHWLGVRLREFRTVPFLKASSFGIADFRSNAGMTVFQE